MNCLCNNPILPLIILFSCCGQEDGVGGLFGIGGSKGGLDQLLWLLCILCLCGNCNDSCDRRY